MSVGYNVKNVYLFHPGQEDSVDAKLQAVKAIKVVE